MKILKFLVYSNSWISIGAFLITLLSFKVFGTDPNIKFCVFIFFSTLFSYNFQRITRLKKIAKLSPDAWIVKNSFIAKIILVASGIGAISFVPIFEAPFTLMWLIILGVISLGYSYRNLRDLPYIKIVLIAVSWGITSAILPLVIAGNQPLSKFVISFGWIFFYIIAITIPFDIRDIGIDEDSKKTIPQWVGVKRAKIVAYLCLMVSFIFIAFSLSLLGAISLFISYIIAGFLIKNSSEKRNDLYFSFLIDGHIIFQFLMVYFLC
mgnify:CR=1 FL=1